MKNEIEQELERKEFELDIHRDLDHQYRKLNAEEKLREGANKYVIGALHFFVTLIFFEVLWWLVSTLINQMSFGFTLSFFEAMTPVMHFVFLALAIVSAFTWKSPIDYFLKFMPSA